MAFPSLSSLWAWFEPAAANHIWQSTVFALVAGLLTLALRKNRARVRYWLWLAASIKFLVPFALLIALGSYLAPPRAPAMMPAGYSYAMEISQPFAPSAITSVTPAASFGNRLSFAQLAPVLLFLIWLSGCVAVLAFWFLRWRRIRALVRQSAPVDAGREAEALRRLERAAGFHRPIPLLLSRASLEPGIFGIFRPVLLWPEGISAHLSDAHLEAILAHELRHVRYRDNLAAAMHTLVQAIFWFHPLVWWMGAQMVRERERGCDEEVVAMGCRPGVYAEGVLKACEFCLASPQASFSGVTGADLKKRIVGIMTARASRKLGRGKKLALAAAGLAAFASPVVFGLLDLPHIQAADKNTAAKPIRFEVVSIRPSKPGGPAGWVISPDGISLRGMNLWSLLAMAYLPVGYWSNDRVVGLPSSFKGLTYDIEAKVAPADIAAWQEAMKEPGGWQNEMLRGALQAVLAERCKLVVHRVPAEMNGYALVVAKHGPNWKELKPTKPGEQIPSQGIKFRDGGVRVPADFNGGPPVRQSTGVSNHAWDYFGATMADLATYYSRPSLGLGPVQDQTGLTGKYDFVLQSQEPLSSGDGPEDIVGSSAWSVGQIGLGLKRIKVPTQTIVIDHIEKPSPN